MPGISAFIRPAAKVGTATGRGTIWPPEEDEEDRESIVVSESTISQGKLEREMQRGLTLGSAPAPGQQSPAWTPKNNGEAMGTIGAELTDPNVQKDPAWWQKALGWLEPLKYMDIPIELAAEAVFDPISMVTGRDLSWVRGTAEREPFEAWDAIFSSDDVSPEVGFGEVLARMDEAADAFEKRPLWAQLGLGAVQIAASFGASGYAKAAQMTGQSMFKANAIRTGAMVLDPWEPAFYGVRAAWRGGRRIVRPMSGVTEDGVSKASKLDELALNDSTYKLHVLEPEDLAEAKLRKKEAAAARRKGKPIGGGSGTEPPEPPPMGPDEIASFQGDLLDEAAASGKYGGFSDKIEFRAEQLWGHGADRYGLNDSTAVVTNYIDNPKYGVIGPDVHYKVKDANNVDQPQLPWTLKVGNQLRHFIRDNIDIARQEVKGTDAPVSEAARVEAGRKAFAVQLSLSIGSRKNHLFKANFEALLEGEDSLLNSGLVNYFDKEGRSVALRALDTGEARAAAEIYKETLVKWSKANKDTILNAYAETNKATPSSNIWDENPLWWLDNEQQVLTFDVNKATNWKEGDTIEDWFGFNKKMSKKEIDDANKGWGGDYDSGASGEQSHRNATLDTILKEAREQTDSMQNKIYGLLPDDSRLIRNIRITELAHEFKSFEEIAFQMKHAKASVSAIYLRSIPFLGPNSPLHRLWSKVAVMRDTVMATSPEVEKRIARAEQTAKNSPLGDKRAKGAKKGAADRTRIGLQLLDAYRGEGVGKEVLESYQPKEWLAILEKHKAAGHLSGSIENRILDMAEEAADLYAIVNYAKDLEKVTSYSGHMKNAIYKNTFQQSGDQYGKLRKAADAGSAESKTLFGNQPGLLNRAGFFREKNAAGKWILSWAGDSSRIKGLSGKQKNIEKVRDTRWLEKREKLRKELSLPAEEYGYADGVMVEGAEKRWTDWAHDNYAQIGHANEAIDGTKVSIKGSRNKYDISELLLEGVDLSTMDLVYRYAEESQRLNARDVENLGLDRLFAGLMKSPVSRAGRDVAADSGWASGNQRAYYNKVRELDKLAASNPLMNEIYGTLNPDGRFGPERQMKAFKELVPDHLLQEWLNDEKVISIFRVNRLTVKDDVKKIAKKLTRMAQNSPRMFGDNFSEWALENVGTAKRKNIQWSTKGTQFIQNLADRLANHKGFWGKIESMEAIRDIPTEVERILAMKPSRASIRGLEGHTDQYGNTLDQITGNINTMPSFVARIDTMQGTMGRAFNEWINKDALINKVLKNTIVNPLAAVFAGGMAGVARPLTRIFSSRAHAYPLADGVGSVAAKALHRHAIDNLGLEVDALTSAQVAMSGGKAKQGMEFFGKLQVHDTEGAMERILEFERSLEGRIASKRFIPNPKSSISGNGGVAHRMRRMLNLGEYAGKVNQDVSYGQELITQFANEGERTKGMYKYLRQVDVVLERIDPEHWHKYYKNMVDEVVVDGKKVKVKSQLWKDLAFLRESINVMDSKLKLNGIDVRKLTDDRQAEYLERYFPRIYYNVSGSTTEDAAGVLTNGASKHFQNREYEDIVDIIGMSLGTHSHQSGSYMLRPLSERAGMYFTSMHKMIIDRQTVDWLKAQQVVIKGQQFVDGYNTERQGLNHLESLIKGKLAKVAEPDPEDLKNLGAAIGSIDSKTLQGLSVADFNDPTKLADLTDDTARPYIKAIAERRHDLAQLHEKKVGNVFSGNKDIAGTDLSWLDGTLYNISEVEQKAIMQYLRVSANWAQKLTGMEFTAKMLKTPTGVMRYLKSGLDLGAPMIHGYNSLVRLPFGKKGVDFISQNAWRKATKDMAIMFWDPDRYDTFIAKNVGVMSEAGNYVRFSTPEPLMALDDKNFMAVREWAASKLPKHKQARFLSRFEAGFSGYLDVLRTELWTAMKVSVDNEIDDMFQAAQKVAEPFDITKIRNERYHDLGATINKMTGAFDPHLSQQTPFQTLVENSLFFFAPMYRRATFGILADIFRPRGGKTSIRREQALRQLSGVVGVGAAVAVLAEMTGNNPRGFLSDTEGELGRGEGELDITSRFGKWNTHGIQVGIGTAWWTAFRAASDIAMHYARDERPVDESKHWSDHWAMELIGRRGRSQMAPGAALFTDVITGRNFIGEPLRDKDENNYSAIFTHIGRSAIPFWLDGLLVGNSLQGTAISGSAEFLGLQSYQQSTYDKLARARQDAVATTDISQIAQWRERQIAEGKRANYISMPKTLQRLLDENETNVNLLLAEHTEKYGKTVAGDAKDLRAYMEEKTQADLMNVQKLATVSRMVETGQADYRALQKTLSAISYNRRVNGTVLLQKYPNLAQYFSDLREGRAESESHFQGDIIYDQWQAMRHNEEFVDEEGRWLGEKAAIAEDAFWMDPQRAQFREYALGRAEQWFSELPTVKRFERAKDIIRESGFWEVEDRLWAPGSHMNILANKFLQMPQDMRDSAKEKNPIYKDIERRISKERDMLSRHSRVLDEMLVTYYGREARHPANRGLEDRLYMERIGGLPITAKHTDFAISAIGRVTSKQLTGVQ